MIEQLSSVTLPEILRDALLVEARAAFPHECCGLLYGKAGRVDATQPAKNCAGEPSAAFEIDPAALVAAQVATRRGGPSVIGYYHSHPNGRAAPSMSDAESAAADGRIWLVIADDRITAWQAVAHGPWLGRFLPLGLEIVA